MLSRCEHVAFDLSLLPRYCVRRPALLDVVFFSPRVSAAMLLRTFFSFFRNFSLWIYSSPCLFMRDDGFPFNLSGPRNF